MSSVLSAITSRGVPAKDIFLPDLNANPHPSLVNGHIVPLYGPGPAPYGVADFGLENVSGTITPYTLSAPALEGTFSPYEMSGLSADISGPDEYGVQLNAVLNNVQILGKPGYEYWTQNVVEYSTFSHRLYFVSNVWNFSNGPLLANTFSQVGPNGTVVAPEYYYSTGGPISISYPFTLDLFLNSTLLSGQDEVFFNFTVSNATEFYSGSYDHVVFNSLATGSSPAPTPEYVAEGSSYNPIGLPNDFEMVLGGPGGGSNFDAFEARAYFGLQFWNTTSHAFESIPSAYGFGSETGETSYGVTALWGTESPLVLPGIPEPNAWVTLGPSNANGLWNVSGQGGYASNYGGYMTIGLTPSNAFLFVAPGSVFGTWTTTNWSLFQWLPPILSSSTYKSYELYPGTYTLIALLANYDPVETTFTILTAGVTPSLGNIGVTMTANNLEGVYTPLWALNNTGVASISALISGVYYLYGNEYLPIGHPGDFSGAVFPWFGIANDYLFPTFNGILLWNTTVSIDVLSPPSFLTYYPTWSQAGLLRDGLPTSNDLQMMFYDDTDVVLAGGMQIGGWWWSAAYFGPAISTYNVVFWNTSYSEVFQNTFATGGNALYLYGGTDNLVFNNTFTESIPFSADPYASVAAAFGSTGIFEADYGNASSVVEKYGGNLSYGCYIIGYCDVIFNNIFDTYITAINPYDDPYAFYLSTPTCPAFIEAVTGTYSCFFEESWNLPLHTWNAPSIIGGPFLGGNFWWNYGDEYNTWSQLPYYNYEPFIGYGIDNELAGDYHPLSVVPLYTVTVTESGLPLGSYWYVWAYENGGTHPYEGGNSTVGTSVTILLPEGAYYLAPYTDELGYASNWVYFDVVNQSVSVHVTFSPAYTVVVSETGLPTGTTWGVSFYNSTGGYVNGMSTSSTRGNVTDLLPGTYTWEAYADSGSFAPLPEKGTLTISANTTLTVTFVPLYIETFAVSGLAAGVDWVLGVTSPTGENFTYLISGNAFAFDAPSGASFTWSVSAVGYVASPSYGTFVVTANATIQIVFSVPATLTFTETGLPSGTPWTVSLLQGSVWTNETSAASSITFANAKAGTYSYTVAATDYSATPASGSGTLPGANVSIAFVVIPGTLSGTVTTGNATVTVDGTAVTVTSGSFSVSLKPGVHAIVATESGYYAYYNNVTVSSGATTTVKISLVAVSSSTTSSSSVGSMGWLLIAILAALAVIFLVTTIYFMGKSRRPPAMTQFQPPAPAAGPGAAAPAEAPPAAPAPPWSEGSPPPGAQ